MDNKSFVITLDGNIGAGKSTILEYIHKNHGIAIDVEPIQTWQPYLNDLYGNKESAAFNIQVRVWLDRCFIVQPSHPTVMERSPMFQRGVFVPVNVTNKQISNKQYEMLDELYTKTGKMWNPKVYIYLRSNPDNCIQRIAKRSRPSEEAISEDYLRTLHDLHESTYSTAIANKKNIHVIDVEGKTVTEIGEEVWAIIAPNIS